MHNNKYNHSLLPGSSLTCLCETNRFGNRRRSELVKSGVRPDCLDERMEWRSTPYGDTAAAQREQTFGHSLDKRYIGARPINARAQPNANLKHIRDFRGSGSQVSVQKLRTHTIIAARFRNRK